MNDKLKPVTIDDETVPGLFYIGNVILNLRSLAALTIEKDTIVIVTADGSMNTINYSSLDSSESAK
jgi:hypothetical protein